MQGIAWLKGLNLLRDGQVLVQSGKRRVAISSAQYRANGYPPSYDKLPLEALPEAVLEAGLATAALTTAHKGLA